MFDYIEWRKKRFAAWLSERCEFVQSDDPSEHVTFRTLYEDYSAWSMRGTRYANWQVVEALGKMEGVTRYKRMGLVYYAGIRLRA